MKARTTRNPNIGGSVGSDIKLDMTGFKRTLKLNVDGKLKKFNHRAPTVFRKCIGEALAEDPNLSKFRNVAKSLKVENRKFGQAKMGSGLTFRIEGKELNMRFFYLDNKIKSVLGIDGFYKLKTYTEGKYRYVIKPDQWTPIRVKEDDPRAHATRKYTSREYSNVPEGGSGPQGVFFVYSAKGVDKVEKFDRKSNWQAIARDKTLAKLKEEFGKL